MRLGGKVPSAAAFLDFSDYARPLARPLAEFMARRDLSQHWATGAFILAGLLAGWAIRLEAWLPAAGLIFLKNLLDATDGWVARLREKPSRVGRYLDSLADFWLHGWWLSGLPVAPTVWLVAWLAASLQGTAYNYYQVLYRWQMGGDRTSFPREEPTSPYPWDPAWLVRVLWWAYMLTYGWQDALMRGLDRRIGRGTPDTAFLTMCSLLGLGMHLAIWVVCLLVGQPRWVPWIFLLPGNAILALVLVLRARRAAAGRGARTR